MEQLRLSDICQTTICPRVELTKDIPLVDCYCSKAPMASNSEETFYTARSCDPSTHSVETKMSTVVSLSGEEQMEAQHKCQVIANRPQYRHTEEQENEVVSGAMSYNQCSRLDDQMMHDRCVCDQINRHKTSSSTSHNCTDKVMPKIHSSHLSLPGSKSIASSKRSMLSEFVVCRICHEGDTSEVLVSPCYCSGSMGLIHVSCLQTWLGSSNKTTCEICNFQFSLVRKPMSVIQFLKNPGTVQDRRKLIWDITSSLITTPLTIFIVWICFEGAAYHSDSKLEMGSWISLSVCCLSLYLVALAVTLHQNWRLWKDWKMFHQKVTLLCVPSTSHIKSDMGETLGAGSRNNSHLRPGSVQLQSVRINFYGPLTRFSRQQKLSKNPKKIQHVEKKSLSAGNILSHSNRKQHQGSQQLKLETQDNGNISEEHRNHGYNHSGGCASYIGESSNFRKSRKKYVVESKLSGQVSNRSSSEQSSLNAVFENQELDWVRPGYRHPGYYTDKPRMYQYTYDRESDTGKPTGSYQTSSEYLPDRSRQAHNNPVYTFQDNRSDSTPDLPTSRPVLTKHNNPRSMAIFSRGGSPNSKKSRDYIAKWVNEQTSSNDSDYDRSRLEARVAEYPVLHKCKSKTYYDKNGPIFQERNSLHTDNSKCGSNGTKDHLYINLSQSSSNEVASMVEEISDSTHGDKSACKIFTKPSLTSTTALELTGKHPQASYCEGTNAYVTNANNFTVSSSKLSPDSQDVAKSSSQCCTLDACSVLETANCLDNNERELIL